MSNEAPEDLEPENVVVLGDLFSGVKQDPGKMLRKIAKGKPKEAVVVYEMEDGTLEMEASNPNQQYNQSLLFTFATKIAFQFINPDTPEE